MRRRVMTLSPRGVDPCEFRPLVSTWLRGVTLAVEWQFDVDTSSRRPIVADEHVSRVTVLADSYPEALTTAVLLASRPEWTW
jgi:hypothetical protein